MAGGRPVRVLILAAPIGSGHLRAAQALAKAFEDSNAGKAETEVRIVDIFSFFPAVFGSIFLKAYLKLLDLVPGVYGTLYSFGNNKGSLSGRELINTVLARKLRRYLNDEFPADCIVCTHATPAGLVARLVRADTNPLLSFAVITDFVVHRWWVYNEIAHYCVAEEKMLEDLIGFGIDRGKCHITGIPIDAAFAFSRRSREEILQTIGLSPSCKTVLVMGGGAGVLPMEEIIRSCSNIDVPIQFIAVAGKNQNLMNRLNALSQRVPHPIKVCGFVDTIPEFMRIADLLVSKPGGMTSAEALCCRLPMILYRPIPGQEEGNAKSLIRSGVAVRADKPEQVRELIENLLVREPGRIDAMRHRAAQMAKPAAARAVAELVLEAARQQKGLT